MNGVRLGIVTSEFYKEITEPMLEKALEFAKEQNAEVRYVFKAPGTFDTILAIDTLLGKDDVDAVVVLGAVVKGETKHDELIAFTVASKMKDLELKYAKPVALGIAGPGMTLLQARDRIEEYARRSVNSAVKMAQRMRTSAGTKKGPFPIVFE